MRARDDNLEVKSWRCDWPTQRLTSWTTSIQEVMFGEAVPVKVDHMTRSDSIQLSNVQHLKIAITKG